MSMLTQFRAMFAATKTQHPELVVAVVSGSQTADGIRSTITADASLTMQGETGATTGIVRVSAADLTEPERGATIKVAGQDVTVQGVDRDPAGALLAIRYSLQRPAGGI